MPSTLRTPSGPVGAVGALALLGCGLLRFEVEQEASTVVEGVGILGGLLRTMNLGELDDLDVAVEQELDDQDVAPGDLRSVRLTAFTLTGAPDLGFLSGLEVFVSAQDFPEVRVAATGDVPDGETEATLLLDDVDLADAVANGGMHFRLAARGDAPEDDTTVTADVIVEVEATAQGACNAAGG